MDPKAMRCGALLAACTFAALGHMPLRAGDEAKPAAPDDAAADALKPFDNPRRIDIEGTALLLAGVLAKLEAHFGWKLSPTAVETDKKTVDLSVKGATYFEALDAVRRAAKLGYIDATSNDAKVLPLALCELGEKGFCLAQAKGPFLFRVNQIVRQTTQEAAFGQASGERQAHRNVTVSICAEPGLKAVLPKIEKAFMAIGPGEKEDAQVWLHESGFRMPGVAKIYAPVFAGTRDAPGPLALGGTLVVQVPQSVERRVIEDLDAEIGKTVDLGGGSLEFQKYIETEGLVTLPFVAKGIATGMVTASQRNGMRMVMMIAAGGLGGAKLEDRVPKDEAGLYFFDANRQMVVSQGMGYVSGGDESKLDCNIRLPARPKGVIVQWTGKQAERTVAFAFDAIPEPCAGSSHPQGEPEP